MVFVAVIAGFAVVSYVLPKGAAFQVSHLIFTCMYDGGLGLLIHLSGLSVRTFVIYKHYSRKLKRISVGSIMESFPPESTEHAEKSSGKNTATKAGGADY